MSDIGSLLQNNFLLPYELNTVAVTSPLIFQKMRFGSSISLNRSKLTCLPPQEHMVLFMSKMVICKDPKSKF